MAALRCPTCGREMLVVRREGNRVTTEHECDPEAARKDAPARAPGSAEGERRWG